MDCSPPGSSVHGILQAGVLGWVAIPFPGDLPDPGFEPARLLCLLHWQVGSLPLAPPESMGTQGEFVSCCCVKIVQILR